MQPYFDPTRKTTSKKIKMEDNLKLKMEDDLKNKWKTKKQNNGKQTNKFKNKN